MKSTLLRPLLQKLKNKLEESLEEIAKDHPGIQIAFGGESKDTQESMISLGRAFMIAVMGVLLILVLTFKQMLQPLVIFGITIPVGVVSAIWAFKLHNMPITFLGLMGVIALAGVIVNNAIVYVDFVNRGRREGLDRFESIYMAAKNRLRPVFLTTVTTAAGLMPTSYGLGGKDPFVTYITRGTKLGADHRSWLYSLASSFGTSGNRRCK